MTFGWQTDKKGRYSVREHLCVFCTKDLCICHCWSASPRWMTIKPSVALASSRYPPTWWVLRDRFFDGRHEQTQAKRVHKDLEQDTAKKRERSGVGRSLFPLYIHVEHLPGIWASRSGFPGKSHNICKKQDVNEGLSEAWIWKAKRLQIFLWWSKLVCWQLSQFIWEYIYILCMYICLSTHIYYIYRYNLETSQKCLLCRAIKPHRDICQ